MPSRARAEPNAFDLWLRRDLRDAYDSTLCEPLPDELQRLVALMPERGREG